MTTFIAICLVAVASVVIRLAPTLAADRFRLSPRLESMLRHAGVGALVALVVLEVSGIVGISW